MSDAALAAACEVLMRELPPQADRDDAADQRQGELGDAYQILTNGSDPLAMSEARLVVLAALGAADPRESFAKLVDRAWRADDPAWVQRRFQKVAADIRAGIGVPIELGGKTPVDPPPSGDARVYVVEADVVAEGGRPTGRVGWLARVGWSASLPEAKLHTWEDVRALPSFDFPVRIRAKTQTGLLDVEARPGRIRGG